MTLGISDTQLMTLSLAVSILNMLSVVFFNVMLCPYAECRYAECLYAGCRGAILVQDPAAKQLSIG
jgi:hypothetical protein